MRYDELTMHEWLFVLEYVKDWRPSDAMRRTGLGGNHPRQLAWQVMQRPHVKAEIERQSAQLLGKVKLSVEMVMQDIKQVLEADPRELIERKDGACRHCYGVGHLYQRTQNEMLRYIVDTRAKGGEVDTAGGTGFNPTKEPNPECPECFGEGVPYSRIKDTRELSPAAAALYFGVKEGKHGTELIMRSKDAAREAAARYLGMNKETIELHTNKKAKDLTDDELASIAGGDDD